MVSVVACIERLGTTKTFVIIFISEIKLHPGIATINDDQLNFIGGKLSRQL